MRQSTLGSISGQLNTLFSMAFTASGIGSITVRVSYMKAWDSHKGCRYEYDHKWSFYKKDQGKEEAESGVLTRNMVSSWARHGRYALPGADGYERCYLSRLTISCNAGRHSEHMRSSCPGVFRIDGSGDVSSDIRNVAVTFRWSPCCGIHGNSPRLHFQIRGW